MKVEDRIKGCLYGIAVADALGACWEGWRPKDINAKFGRVTEMMEFNGWAPGEFTDDTFLTLAGCRAYNEANGNRVFSPEYAGEAMVAWMQNLGKGIGILTNRALANISSGRCDVYSSGRKALASVGRSSAGNGSLMRCAATGLVRSLDDIDTIVEESTVLSEITHADTRCVAACVGYNIILAGLLEGEDLYTLLKLATEKTASINLETSAMFDKHKQGNGVSYNKDEMISIGYVLRALDCALGSLESGYSKEGEDILENTIIDVVNEGGDADTNAAITGGLVGALYGYDAIPQRWIDALQYRQEIEDSYDMLIKFRNR